MERETRFELATLALARRCSTTELLPLSKRIAFLKVVERNVPLFLPLCPEALFAPLADLNGPNKPATPLREMQRGKSCQATYPCARLPHLAGHLWDSYEVSSADPS